MPLGLRRAFVRDALPQHLAGPPSSANRRQVGRDRSPAPRRRTGRSGCRPSDRCWKVGLRAGLLPLEGTVPMAKDGKVTSRDRRPRVRRRVHPDLPAPPERRDVRDLPARSAGELDECGDRFGIDGATPTTRSCSPTRTSTPSTSTRRSPTTRRSRSPRSRPASTWPAPCRWPPRSTSAGRSSRQQRAAARST